MKSYLKNKLTRTREAMFGGVGGLFFGGKNIDQSLLEEIETHLLVADVGVNATKQIIDDLTQKVHRKELNNIDGLAKVLKVHLVELLQPCAMPLVIENNIKPFVILMVGVNGSGKTTTIGKLAKKLQQDGKKVILAAGDTFRAAAIEQLQVWGEHNNIPVIAQQHGADTAAVIFDAMQAAKTRGFDILIADTAGRLHTQEHLMNELKKIKRILSKIDPAAPHEIILVLDAGIGQNALIQAKQFKEAIGVTGIALTKLDGTAKGGIIFAIAKNLAIPIRFIGVGEGIDDLQQFNAEEFVEALL
jgi:fused signal recognition particle receptor